MVAVATWVHPPASVTVTLYTPAGRFDKSSVVAVNEAGPVHA